MTLWRRLFVFTALLFATFGSCDRSSNSEFIKNRRDWEKDIGKLVNLKGPNENSSVLGLAISPLSDEGVVFVRGTVVKMGELKVLQTGIVGMEYWYAVVNPFTTTLSTGSNEKSKIDPLLGMRLADSNAVVASKDRLPEMVGNWITIYGEVSGTRDQKVLGVSVEGTESGFVYARGILMKSDVIDVPEEQQVRDQRLRLVNPHNMENARTFRTLEGLQREFSSSNH